MEMYKILASALRSWQQGTDMKAVLEQNREKLSAEDYAYFHRMFKGIVETYNPLKGILQQYSKMPFKKYRENHLNYMLIGLFSILAMRKPDHAIVNEIVELVKAETPGLASMTNAILRHVIRDGVSLKTGINDSLADLIHRDYGGRFLEDYQLSLFGESSLEVLSMIPRERLMEELKAEGHEVEPLSHTKAGVRITKLAQPLKKCQAFQDGHFYVQAEGSMIVSDIISNTKGKKVLDLCASPGGKTFSMYVREPGRSYTMNDQNQAKIDRIRENLDRLKLDFPTTIQDARILRPDWIEAFDVVFIDAPCSGSGILKRQPEIAKSRTAEDVERVTELAYSIMQTAASYVKSRGFMIYSTCSILKKENEQQIERFLKEHPEYSRLTISGLAYVANGYIKTLPNQEHLDGFFGALLQRK